MRPTATLFDLDGVIIDSERLYTEFWSKIEEIYPTGIPNFPVAIKGSTLPEILVLYPTEEIRKDVTRRLNEFQDSMVFPLLPGAIEFLDSLKEQGIPRALVTSSDTRKMDCLFRQLPQLREKFDVILDASKVTKSKPDPQGYLIAAEALGAKPEECVVFEDSLNGLKAARASGAKVVALATTYPAEELKGMGDLIISEWSEMDFDRL